MSDKTQTVPLVDPHFHIWDLETNRYPWLTQKPPPIQVAGDVEPIARNYLIEDYLADARSQGLVKAVHVDAGWDAADPVGETRWLQSVTDRTGYPHGIVAYAALDHDGAEEILAGHCEFAAIRGIRHILNWHADPQKSFLDRDDLLTDDAWLRGYALLRRFGLSFDLQLYPSQMPAAAEVAARFPETQVILNHAGMPADKDAEGLAMWREGLRLLAERPNVTIKISGLGMLDWHWSEASIRPFVLECIDIFGTDRAMFASNFPVDRLYSSYDTLFGAFRSIVGDFSESDQQKLFHDTATRVYRL
ncbi:MAG: amidohydrolase family protein [Hyphomicrobiales bacterium]|nr:amidohydrolase family protein [Hyphomicrobiales bacterium]